MATDRLSLTRQVLLLAGLMVVTFPFRFLPYWMELHEGWLMCLWGASPVLAMFLVSVARCRSRWIGVTLPLVGFIVTDLVIELILRSRNLPSSTIGGRLFFYGLYLLLSQLGLLIRRAKGGTAILAGVGVGMLGSVMFFLVTNFLIWLRSDPSQGLYYYPPTWAGLVKCYGMALPFFQNQFLFDVIFAVVLFGAYELLARAILARASRPVMLPKVA